MPFRHYTILLKPSPNRELSFIINLMRKQIPFVLLLVCLLAVSLYGINRDLFRYEFNSLCERDFVPERDAKGDYAVLDLGSLKPAKYTLSLTLTAEGIGSGVYLAADSGEEIFAAELTPGTVDPVYEFTVEGGTKHLSLGIRYDPAYSTVALERVRVTSEHVLYKDSLLRHALLSGLAALLALLIGLRICAPNILRKVFPFLNTKENEYVFLFLIILTIISCYPLFNADTYVRGEDMFFHITRVKGIAEGLRAGYFPVRDEPYWLNGYGYGTGFYYPDVFLYVPALLTLCGVGLLSAYKVFLVLCTFFSVLSMWYAVYRISDSRMGGCAAAVLYAFAAYRLSNLYYRGTVGETQAAMFLPLIILGLYEIFYDEKHRWTNFAFGFLGLLCCHVISLTMAGVITAVVLLTQLPKIIRDKAILPALLKSVLLVVGLGAFFWLPMAEQSLTNPNLKVNSVLTSGTAKLNFNYAFPPANLFLRFHDWNYAYQARCIYPGWAFWLVPLLRIPLWKTDDRRVRRADFMLVLSFVLLWLCTTAFPWKLFMGFVTRIQFAYRLLLPAAALNAVCGGIYFMKLIEGRKTSLGAAAFAALACFCFVFTAYPVLNESVRNRTVAKDLFVMQDNRVSGAEYMPVGLETDFPAKNADTVFIEEGNVTPTITFHDRQGLSFTFSYELPEGSGEVRFTVPFIYYTGFRAELETEDSSVTELPVEWDSRGLTAVGNAGAERGTIRVWYAKTAAQIVGEIITLLTAGVFVILRKRVRSADIIESKEN